MGTESDNWVDDALERAERVAKIKLEGGALLNRQNCPEFEAMMDATKDVTADCLDGVIRPER